MPGPHAPDRSPPSQWPAAGERWPAAGERFALFAEVVAVGTLVTLAALPLLSALPALAAGCAHLRRHLRGQRVSLAGFLRTLRAALVGSWQATVPAAALAALLALDLALVRAGLPAAPAVLVAGVLASGAGLVVAARAAAAWRPGARWSALTVAAAQALRRDAAGSALLACAWLLVAVLTWQLPPLLLPAVGCLALAALAIDDRSS